MDEERTETIKRRQMRSSVLRATCRAANSSSRVGKRGHAFSSSAASSASTSTAAPAQSAAASAGGGQRIGIIPRVSAFLAGVGCTCVASYVQLHEDIWESTIKVEKALADLRSQSVEEVAHLRLRVSTLEKEILVLKASKK